MQSKKEVQVLSVFFHAHLLECVPIELFQSVPSLPCPRVGQFHLRGAFAYNWKICTLNTSALPCTSLLAFPSLLRAVLVTMTAG